MQRDEERIPVIVGGGEITDRPQVPIQALEPAALMAEALARAEADAGAVLLAKLDSLDIVNELSWPYIDPTAEVAARAQIAPRRVVYGPVGGQTPIEAIHAAALRISRGESAVAAVCGAEAEHAVHAAVKAMVSLPWGDRDMNYKPVRAGTFQQPAARALDVATPAHVYPLYENATQHAWGQTPEEGLRESAQLWADYSAIAASRPNAWLKRHHEAKEIATPNPQNRLIAWPYPKLMVANPLVNQGAAVIVTSLGFAKRAGIAPRRMIFILGGAAAKEPEDFLARDTYSGVRAMQAVLAVVPRFLPRGRERFDLCELYSCFPCVPKMARRLLGLELGTPLTVAGGLTFFGAPLNNYMTHAAVAMIERLRADPGGIGLLYGQGGYATKHHALLVTSADITDAPVLAPDYDIQKVADELRAPVPRLVADYAGPAELETFTVLFDREGQPRHGVVIARPKPQARLIARVPGEDAGSLAKLMSFTINPIGAWGRADPGGDGLLRWSFT